MGPEGQCRTLERLVTTAGDSCYHPAPKSQEEEAATGTKREGGRAAPPEEVQRPPSLGQSQPERFPREEPGSKHPDSLSSLRKPEGKGSSPCMLAPKRRKQR